LAPRRAAGAVLLEQARLLQQAELPLEGPALEELMARPRSFEKLVGQLPPLPADDSLPDRP
jgi:hypothetical protein